MEKRGKFTLMQGLKFTYKISLNTRTDNNSALFVSLLKPYDRLKISGVEIRLRELGRKTNIRKVHPHNLEEQWQQKQ